MIKSQIRDFINQESKKMFSQFSGEFILTYKLGDHSKVSYPSNDNNNKMLYIALGLLEKKISEVVENYN